MDKYEIVMKIMDEKYKKDEIWSVSTVNGDSHSVRFVNGYYEDGAVYTVTHMLSKKMQSIAVNPRVAVCSFWYTGHGTGENLGWVRDEKNAKMMEKLREVFKEWYDNGHTNEEDTGTCLLRIQLDDGVIIDQDKKYGDFMYQVNFQNHEVKSQ